MFKPVNSKVDFPAMEREVMQWWGDNDTIKKYLKRNAKSEKRFSFIDGPVTANNPLGGRPRLGAQGSGHKSSLPP